LSLAKLLSSSFVVRGPQLSIVRRLDSQFIIQIHNALLTWIGKRLAVYEANKDKKAIKKAVQFFKVLVPLLVGVDNRDALKMSGDSL
jgi:cohesin complex subunit SA-1/2